MKKIAVLFLLHFLCIGLFAQEIDADLLKAKSRLDSILSFSTQLKLEVDISFINMPVKKAQMYYVKGKKVKFSSDDFVMLPKRGMDFSLNSLLEYSFITVDRGLEQRGSKLYKAINIIPTDKRADFSIATILIDTKLKRVMESEINTKKDGSYLLIFQYNTDSKVLPDKVTVNFEIEKIRIPINFMGKDTELDRKKMKEAGPKTGAIYLTMSNYQIKSVL
ncbi:hypothetical protein [Sediminibacterium sp.]|uniref:hypothetical protein n=1 Tax=Sediminibacterium sp. TaxID=1917865 RepID=UPI002734356F|nr:hypothetical protein [Sediminibacterium sp.]MDP3393149.1 hypothetical protein [Sediminibacterium sp.]MDP3567751.1 hypothetical protein [Sediminibacterium sp.]